MKLAVVVAFGGALLAPAGAWAQSACETIAVLDDFSVAQSAVEAGPGLIASNQLAGASSLGERDLQAESFDPGDDPEGTVRAELVGGALQVTSTIKDAGSVVRVVYDGDDASQGTDFDGLGGLDLTTGARPTRSRSTSAPARATIPRAS